MQLAHEMFFWFHLIVFLAAVGFDLGKLLLVLAAFSWLNKSAWVAVELL